MNARFSFSVFYFNLYVQNKVLSLALLFYSNSGFGIYSTDVLTYLIVFYYDLTPTNFLCKSM